MASSIMLLRGVTPTGKHSVLMAPALRRTVALLKVVHLLWSKVRSHAPPSSVQWAHLVGQVSIARLACLEHKEV